jgi:hypothetical protein
MLRRARKGTKEPWNSPMIWGAVRGAIVLGARESLVQGEGPQCIGVWNARYLNENTEVHLWMSGKSRKDLV